MFKNILSGTEGVDVYGIFSLVVFFVFFSIMIVWIIKVKKPYLNKMSLLPLDDTETLKQNQTELE
ncbi:MAG TPA: CcoQ/FixQ family Cbb3-type cytochrome c oxidase assembly chaperone [Ignavibacteria bacterium]|nr:CcoQ/FixQ family Cbb3-type cytochrome c oxidase assembly chaperone [Ignavibacteria bacterium]